MGKEIGPRCLYCVADWPHAWQPSWRGDEKKEKTVLFYPITTALMGSRLNASRWVNVQVIRCARSPVNNLVYGMRIRCACKICLDNGTVNQKSQPKIPAGGRIGRIEELQIPTIISEPT